MLLLLWQLCACDSISTQQLKKVYIRVGIKKLRVELATKPSEREEGLMHRSRLGYDEGMLFVFPFPPRKVVFWMKNTFIPLDVGYFTSEQRLIEYMTMQPDEGKKTYPASDLTLYALETNAGWFQKNNIQKGALLNLPHKISGH